MIDVKKLKVGQRVLIADKWGDTAYNYLGKMDYMLGTWQIIDLIHHNNTILVKDNSDVRRWCISPGDIVATEKQAIIDEILNDR